MEYDFQEDNSIISLSNGKFKFKDSYTIKIHDCVIESYTDTTITFLLPNKDNELELFFGEILIAVGINDGDYSENMNKITVNICSDFCSKESLSKSKQKLVISLNLSKFCIIKDSLTIDFSLIKMTATRSNPQVISVNDIIKKGYIPPIDIDSINTKLQDTYNVSSSDIFYNVNKAIA
jgi:hypothetical protein